MKLLALDTSTDVMSVAVCRHDQGAPQVWQHQGAGGAQASLHLLATIERLMAEAGMVYGELDAVCFGAGPGSFTGLRTACSVAQGLGFGAGVPLLPVGTLQAVAEEARQQHWPDAAHGMVLTALDARMDEMYVGLWAFHRAGQNVQWHALEESRLLRPEALQPPASDGPWVLAGNAAAVYGERFDAAIRARPSVLALPTATAMLRLAPALLAAHQAVPADEALPLYVRDKVAQTTEERAAARATRSAGAA